MTAFVMHMKTAERQIVINSDFEELSAVEAFIDALNAEYGFSEDLYGRIIIAVTEAVNNAILHGNKFDRTKYVTITFRLLNENTLSFLVRDEGAGFDYHKQYDPTAAENLLTESGRGVFVMRAYTDSLIFNDKGNEVDLRFNNF